MKNNIQDLKWESIFFEKKIGVLKYDLTHPIDNISKDYELIVVEEKHNSDLALPFYSKTYVEEKVFFKKKTGKYRNKKSNCI